MNNEIYFSQQKNWSLESVIECDPATLEITDDFINDRMNVNLGDNVLLVVKGIWEGLPGSDEHKVCRESLWAEIKYRVGDYYYVELCGSPENSEFYNWELFMDKGIWILPDNIFEICKINGIVGLLCA